MDHIALTGEMLSFDPRSPSFDHVFTLFLDFVKNVDLKKSSGGDAGKDEDDEDSMGIEALMNKTRASDGDIQVLSPAEKEVLSVAQAGFL